MTVVKDISTLKKMAKLGHIEFHKDTGTKIEGLNSNKKFTCCYVWDGKCQFEYNGKKYGIKYFDGCFMPFVIEIN